MKKNLIPVFCVAAALSACGGGGDGNASAPAPAPAPAPTAEVPSNASTSVSALVAYLSALVASSADTLEPVDVSNVVPPVDDYIEPSSVD